MKPTGVTPAGELPRLKVLLTEGSSTSARETLYALGGRHTIDILDPAPLCQCRFSRFVRRWHRCPSFSREPEAYLAFLVEKLDRHRYDVLFPTHEQVFLLSRYRDALARRVGLAVPEFVAVERMISKSQFVGLLAELGLPFPETKIVHGRSELLDAAELPCFVKSAQSTAGEGVRLVRTRDELLRAADDFDRAGWLTGGVDLLVQRPAEGVKGSMSGIFCRGRLVAAYCDEATAIGVGGSSLGRVSIDHPRAIDDLRTIGAHLGWHGAMAIEFFRNPATNTLQYIECNPRIGETVNNTLAGANFCEQLLRVSLGEDPPPLPPPRPGVRTHQGFLALVARALEGGGRWRLLREIGCIMTGRGFYAGGQDELTRPGDDWMSIFPALAVGLQLLAWPGSARWLVRSTVNNYSLSETAARTIRNLPASLPCLESQGPTR